MTERKTPVEEVIDLFVYAPIGFLFNASEVVPLLVEQGKKQVKLARMFGRYAVDKQAPKLLNKLQTHAATVLSERLGRSARDGAGTPAPNGSRAATAAPEAEVAQVAARDHAAAAALAIPDYDSLSASQVVPRLAGLSPAELAAVGEYEAGHRGRKTILNKVAQLQAG